VDCLLELAPVLGQLVDGRGGRRRQLLPPHDSAGLEVAQPRREDVRADARQSAQQVGVAPGPVQQVADDQQRPALADELERVGDGTVLGVALHPGNILNNKFVLAK
jgi:hypothetical protein